MHGPTTFEIPAQQASINIPLDVIDDAFLDGIQMVTISARAGGYSDGLVSLAVADEELISVTSDVSQAKEMPVAIRHITVSRSNSDRSTNLLVLLTSSDLSEAVVPASIVIPAGQSSLLFASYR